MSIDKLQRLLEATLTKLSKEQLLNEEYEELEAVPPAPGDPWGQHDAMVKNKLCVKAQNNRLKNRYCNLFPFDENVVELPGDDYINASWIELGQKYIVTMAPMHPDSYNDSYLNDVTNQGSSPNTCPDFWKMVDSSDSKMVVMLCQVAPGFTGCSPYFPTKQGDSHVHKDYKVCKASCMQFGLVFVQFR